MRRATTSHAVFTNGRRSSSSQFSHSSSLCSSTTQDTDVPPRADLGDLECAVSALPPPPPPPPSSPWRTGVEMEDCTLGGAHESSTVTPRYGPCAGPARGAAIAVPSLNPLGTSPAIRAPREETRPNLSR